MVNIKTPLNPVHKRKPPEWPPKGAREYSVLDSDDWWKVAAREHLDVWELIKFNFQTHVPEEVNWYLRELVGCRHSKDGLNYAFFGADPKKRKIYLPVVPPPPPAPVPCLDQLKKLKYEVEHSNDPQRDRFLCILDALVNNRDDRVILWPDVAPEDAVVRPLGVSSVVKNLHDWQWLHDHIKTWQDLAAMPLGNGFPNLGTVVVSFKKYLCEGFSPTIFYLRSASDMVANTHENLDRWSNVGMGGSLSMALHYQAIKEFVRLRENSPGSVASCFVK
jgi:hypothetical protein